MSLAVAPKDLEWWRSKIVRGAENNPVAPWELRVRQLRVFYEAVGSGESAVVRVLAVGRKLRNVLMIGGKEIPL